MKRLKAVGVWTAILLAVGVLGLAGCDDGGEIQPGLLPGANIVEPFRPRPDGITSSEFSIVATTVAIVAPPNPGNQVAQYGLSTTTNGTITWREPGVLTFTRLTEETEYYIWARAAETSEYAAGRAVMGEDPVETLAEGDEMSVRAWTPNPTYDSNASFFTIVPAQPVISGKTVEYALHNTNSRSRPPTTWSSTVLRWNISRLGSEDPTQTPYYFWARTTDQVGEPRIMEVTLPGPTLTRDNWEADGIPLSGGSSATITVRGGLTKTPEIPAIEIQYGLGPSATVTENIIWSQNAPNNDGQLTFTGLAANTSYYLYARTKQPLYNFFPGPPLLYSASSIVITGNPTTSNAYGLRDQLNGMKANSASLQDNQNTVAVIQDVVLNANIQIPSGVTLIISSTTESAIKLDARNFSITGGGKVEVHGKLEADGYKITVPVTVYNRGDYTSTSAMGTQALVNSTDTSIMKLSTGVITVKYTSDTNGKFDWTLLGEAAVNQTNTLLLGPSDTFTVGEHSKLTVNGNLAVAGKIEVSNGATLHIVGDNYNFATGLNSPGAQIIIHAGAFLDIGSDNMIGYVGQTTLKPETDANFLLNPAAAAGATVVIQLQETDRFIGGERVYDTRYTLSGAGTVAEVGNDVKFANIFVVNSGTMIIPSSKKLEITTGGNLDVRGIVDVNNGGTLTIAKNGNLDVRGTVNVNYIGNFTIDTGAVVRGGSTINVNGGRINAPITFNEFTYSTVTLKLDKDAQFKSGNKVFLGKVANNYTTPNDIFVYSASQTNIANPNISIVLRQTGATANPVITLDANITLASDGTMAVNHEYTVPANRTLTINGGATFTVNGTLTVAGTVAFQSDSKFGTKGTNGRVFHGANNSGIMTGAENESIKFWDN
jgi:hypothetical protein